MDFEKAMVAFVERIKEIPAPQPRRASPAALRTLLVKADDVFIAARFSSSPDRRRRTVAFAATGVLEGQPRI
jgi:hypothetical protein